MYAFEEQSDALRRIHERIDANDVPGDQFGTVGEHNHHYEDYEFCWTDDNKFVEQMMRDGVKAIERF